MSNRAAYNFLSSISLGGNQQKKDPQAQPQPTVPTQAASHPPPPEKHHSHREHFKAKLTSTLEKKHALIHRHDKHDKHHTSSTSLASSNAINGVVPTASKPVIHPNSLKRSSSNITISNNDMSSSSNMVVRSTSGNAIQSREPSPRDKQSPRDSSDSIKHHGESSGSKSRNNSIDQGQATTKRESGEYNYGIMRKGSDAGTRQSRTNSTEQAREASSSALQTSSSFSKPRSDSIDNGDKREIRRKSTNGESIAKVPTESKGSSSNLLISTNAVDYRKLSKSTSDARTSSQTSINTPHRSVSSSSGALQNKLLQNVSTKDEKRSSKSSKHPIDRNDRKLASNPRSPLKSSSNQLENDDESLAIQPERYKRHRRKKSKQKSKAHEQRRTAAIKHNPAAVDFLKGISLGENTPTLKHRKSYHGKSKQTDSTQKRDQQDNSHDTILFVGSSSTKKIKINEYAAQPVPGKIYLSTRTSSTFAVFSLIKYDGKSSKKDKEKVGKEPLNVSQIGKKAVPGAPVTLNAPKNEAQEVGNEQEYDPYFLDDPSLTTGKHRTVMNLASFKESIIPYVRPGVIKDELNELFRQKHPWVPSGVTLHKIRKLKKALVVIGHTGGLEVSTVAIAYVLFEKLIMQGIITKPLIRMYGAVCLLLAAKSNDPNGKELKPTIEAIEKHLDVEPKEMFLYEFPVFSAFGCCLLLPAEHVIPHIRLIIKDHQDLVGNPY